MSRNQVDKAAGKKISKTKGAGKCHTISKTSESPKVLKWPHAAKRPRLRLFVVSGGATRKARRADARARTEFHKFWTDCPAC